MGARDQLAGPWHGAKPAIRPPFEDSNATGISRDENDNTGYESGSGYVFARRTHWSQRAPKGLQHRQGTAPNETGDYFGMAMAFQDTVVGSSVEASAQRASTATRQQ
jgi:hypothetical protein